MTRALLFGQCFEICSWQQINQVMVWCCKTPSHYLRQCWPQSTSYSHTELVWKTKSFNVFEELMKQAKHEEGFNKEVLDLMMFSKHEKKKHGSPLSFIMIPCPMTLLFWCHVYKDVCVFCGLFHVVSPHSVYNFTCHDKTFILFGKQSQYMIINHCQVELPYFHHQQFELLRYHILTYKVETKCLPLWRRYLQFHFLEWKLLYLIQISLKFVPMGLTDNESSSVAVNYRYRRYKSI